jgi:putative membrane protein
MSWADWQPAPLVLGAAAVASWRFAYGFLRLRRRGRADHAGWSRMLLFGAGLALSVLPLVSPLDGEADRRLSVHMLQHVLVGDAGPALLVLAVRGPLLAFVVPVSLARVVALVERLPVWAGAASWGLAIGCWHVPAAYDAALHHELVHDAEHGCFVAAGLLVWTQLLDPARRRRLSAGGRLAYAACLYVLGQMLADTLFLAGPLYPAYGPVSDQQAAGLVMMAEQTLVLGVYAGFVLRGLARGASAPRAARLAATA